MSRKTMKKELGSNVLKKIYKFVGAINTCHRRFYGTFGRNFDLNLLSDYKKYKKSYERRD